MLAGVGQVRDEAVPRLCSVGKSGHNVNRLATNRDGIGNGFVYGGACIRDAVRQGRQAIIPSSDVPTTCVQARHYQSGFIQGRLHVSGGRIIRPMAFDRIEPCGLGLADRVGQGPFGPHEPQVGRKPHASHSTLKVVIKFWASASDSPRGDIPRVSIAYARTPRKLPDILSANEVVRFLEAVPSLKARAALTTAYAAGLRASEAVSLKIDDIYSDRMLIQVRYGKGAKDRTVMLSPQLLEVLRTYWRLARPETWLFPGRGDKPIDV